jgi:glutamine synthetase
MADGFWAGGRWVTWGTQNRETPLRKVAGSHWEIKCLDGLANVYLAMAAIITAGTEGVKDKEILTWHDCEEDPASLSAEERVTMGIDEGLPKDLNEALECLESEWMLRKKLGEEVIMRYIKVKRAEMKLLDGMSAHDRQQWLIERY